MALTSSSVQKSFGLRSAACSAAFLLLWRFALRLDEVIMSGGSRLLLLVLFSFLFVIAVFGDDASAPPSSASGPPVAEKKPTEENFYGHEITDSYRWLEDAKSPETRKWVSEELAYTRSILDPLPERSELHSRLEKLLSIGTISAPQIGGQILFLYQARGHSEPAGSAGPRRFGRERSPAGGCECAGAGWNHRPRLVGAIGRWEVRRLRNLAQRF